MAMETRSVTKYVHGILLVFSIIIAAGCDKIELGEPFDCKVDTKYLLTPTLAFTIDSVNDYRCPRDVVCIWGGDVDLFFNIKLTPDKIDTVLNLSGGPFIFGDYSLSILEVNPLRNHDQIVAQSDYRVKVLIQKN
jgi:hypothetical protein